MADYQIVFNDAALAELIHDAALGAEVAAEGERIAAEARRIAPRGKGKDGHGADSIHAETHFDIALDEWDSRVGWDQLHAYMRFPDFGTKYEPAQRFMERAADRYARP